MGKGEETWDWKTTCTFIHTSNLGVAGEQLLKAGGWSGTWGKELWKDQTCTIPLNFSDVFEDKRKFSIWSVRLSAASCLSVCPSATEGESRALLGTPWCSVFQDVVAGTEAVANRGETKAGKWRSPPENRPQHRHESTAIASAAKWVPTGQDRVVGKRDRLAEGKLGVAEEGMGWWGVVILP